MVGGLVGDVWGAVNPVDTVAGGRAVVRPLGLTEDEPGWGQWPAVVGMIVFPFYELAGLLISILAVTVLFALGVWWTEGHIGAVAAAHDRAVELFPPAVSLRSQFGMLAVMVAYSSLGLWLLLTA